MRSRNTVRYGILYKLKKESRGRKNEKNYLFGFDCFNAFGTYRLWRKRKMDS